MTSTKQRFTNKLLALLLFCIIIVGCLSISAIAYTDTSTNSVDFSDQPIPYISSNPVTASDVFDNALKTFIGNSASEYVYRTVNYDIYCFAVGTTIYFASDHDTFAYIRRLNNITHTDYDNGARTINVSTVLSVNNTNYYYGYYNYGSSYSQDNLIPIFSSVNDGISAVNDWIVNPPVVGPGPQPLNISLPAGNAIYIDITGLSPSATLSTSTPNRYFSSPHSGNQTLSYTDTIVSSGSSIPGNSINWQGTGSTDLLGRYRSWSSTLIVQPGKKYIAIFNPYYNSNDIDVEHEDANYPIQIYVSQANSYNFIALNSNVVSGSIDNTTSSDTYTGSYDEDTDTWVTINDTTGEPGNPAPGGNLIPQTANSIADWLQNIANSISGFFNGAIGAVTTLSSAIGNFASSLQSLYTWLPGAVLGILTSAITLAITIGVIKVFI